MIKTTVDAGHHIWPMRVGEELKNVASSCPAVGGVRSGQDRLKHSAHPGDWFEVTKFGCLKLKIQISYFYIEFESLMQLLFNFARNQSFETGVFFPIRATCVFQLIFFDLVTLIYLLRGTNHESPPCGLLSCLLLFFVLVRPAQMSTSAPCSSNPFTHIVF